MRILRELNSEGGGGESQTPAADSQSASTIPAAQPHAVVASGERTERERELEAELERVRASAAKTEAEKKEREQQINQLQDNLRRVTEQPAPAKQKKSADKGYILFRPSED